MLDLLTVSFYSPFSLFTSDEAKLYFIIGPIRPLMQRPMMGQPGVRPPMRPAMNAPIRPLSPPVNRPPISPAQANLVAPLQNMHIQTSPQVRLTHAHNVTF